jgi:YggT family protein
MYAPVATVRSEIADLIESLIFVYVLIIIAYIVTSLVFSFGLRIPYSRPLNAVLEFLRDVADPYLRIFRRLPLRIGPLDLSPIVAILALQFGGAIIVGIIRG